MNSFCNHIELIELSNRFNRFQAIHKGLNCQQYQEELKYGKADDRTTEYLEQMIAKNEAMRCPKCQVCSDF